MFSFRFVLYRIKNVPDNTNSATMKIPLGTEHDRLPTRYALAHIRPLPRQLDRRLDGLGAGVHGEDHVVAEHLRDGAGELAEEGVVEGAGGEGEFLGLGDEGGDDAGVAVALDGVGGWVRDEGWRRRMAYLVHGAARRVDK